MRKRFIRLLSLICAVALLAVVFAACGGSQQATGGETSQSAAQTTGTATQAETEKFSNKTLDFYAFQGGYGREYWDAIIPQFEQKYGVKVNLTISPKIGEVLRPKMVAGLTPDIIYLNFGDSSGIMEALAKEKAFYDLTAVFDENALDKYENLKDIILPGFLSTTRCAPYQDGKIYCAPFYYSTMGLVYNVDYFTKKNLSLPKTWDDFFALGETAKADNRALFTYQGIYPGYLEEILWPAIAGAVGEEGMKKIFNYEEGSFKNDTVKKVLQNIQDIANKGYLMKGTVALNHTQSQADMMMGKALFIPNGGWMEGEMADAPREDGFQFGITPAPVLTATDPTYAWIGVETLAIPLRAPNPELAKEFLKYQYTDEAMKINAEKAKGLLPVKGALELCKPIISPSLYNFFAMFEKGVLPLLADWKTLPEGSKVNMSQEVFDKCVTQVMNGQMTVDQWMDNVEKAMKQIRDDEAKAQQQ